MGVMAVCTPAEKTQTVVMQEREKMKRSTARKIESSVIRRLVVILAFTALLTVGFAYAKTPRTVKVAFFPMDGYHVFGADGSYGGMDVDYLNILCRYSGWEIEYVPCESWDEALQKLEEHAVDLVGSAQYSEERVEVYDYADLSSGYTYGMIATNANGRIAYEDFDAMQDITYGMVKSYVRRYEFYQYMEDNGIPDPKINWYADTQSLQRALNRGEIDAMVHTFTEIEEGQRIIGRFAPQPFYYITWKGNDELLRELNTAIADVKFNYPELETELMHQYYESKLDKTVLLSTEEKAYLHRKNELVVGYLDGHYPFSYTDEETGEFAGLSRELLEDAFLWTGVRLTFVEFESHAEVRAALIGGEIDLQAYCIHTDAVSESDGLRLLEPYAEPQLVLVTSANKGFDEIESLATIPGFSGQAGQAINMKGISLVSRDSERECIDLLSAGYVDAALCDAYLVEYLLRTEWKYQNLDVVTVLDVKHTVHMVVSQDEGFYLESILSKTIPVLDAQDIREYTFQENTYPLMSLNSFLRDNSLAIVIALLLLITAIIAAASHIVRDSRRIQQLMYKDPSMDVWNMNYLYYMGEQRIQNHRNVRHAVVSLNISKLRRYNIVYGWEAGQRLLEITNSTLEKCIDDKKEICARSYADRFVLLLAWEDWDELLKRLEILRQLVEEFIFREMENRMWLSMGVYEVPLEASTLREAVNCANQALEQVGSSDKYENRIAVYDAAIDTMMTERHVREALLETVDIQEHFTVFYQNKVDIRTGDIVGAEALVRFFDPSANGALRSPAYFIQNFEQTGRIVELDFFVMESVCRMLRKRLDEGKTIVPISCNFSRMHFGRPGFPERFEAILEKYQLSKELVEVEITETLVMEELQQNTIKETLNTLKEKGIRLSIDDFGAGYSSLGTFVQVPASTIKLDRSFLLNHENRERQLQIMRGIVKMSEALDAQIVCEGVETESDLDVMREINAYVAQGYYYSKPAPQTEFEAALDAKA